MANIKHNVKEVREFLGISQAELARRTGLQPAVISHFETGGRVPNIANLIKLSKALGVSTDRLIFGVIDKLNKGE